MGNKVSSEAISITTTQAFVAPIVMAKKKNLKTHSFIYLFTLVSVAVSLNYLSKEELF